ncbi:MAG: preprotein translocase subunit SecG [Epulopiscium sp.]|nr:preprotein translocase subunit SecG [Candidatus Epulonipiscium sp.]
MSVLKVIFTVIYLIAAVAIIGIVLMQEGKSAGLGSLTGSGDSGGDSYWNKIQSRSLEGKLEQWTKIVAGLFILMALLLMLIS